MFLTNVSLLTHWIYLLHILYEPLVFQIHSIVFCWTSPPNFTKVFGWMRSSLKVHYFIVGTLLNIITTVISSNYHFHLVCKSKSHQYEDRR
ncbi:hypothetical protein Hdeb2414_s0001g00001781 [Helianthus debilis subsp. tardiflorus]